MLSQNQVNQVLNLSTSSKLKIIANPPYGAKLEKKVKEYLSDKYYTTEYNFDTYKTFFELGFNILKSEGYLGYITPNTFFTLELGANKLRKYLYNNILLKIVEVYNVFPNAVVEPVVTIFRKKIPKNEELISICIPRKIKLTSTFLNEGIEKHFTQYDLKKDPQYIFNYRESKEEQDVCAKMKKFPRLDTLFDVMTGAKPYQKGKGTPPQTKEVVDKKPFTGLEKKDDSWVPYMRGRLIDRYVNMWEGKKEYIKYGIWLAEPRSEKVFKGKKLFIRQTGDNLIATYDEGNVSNNTLHSIFPLETNKTVSLYYLLGILNSKLMNWYYRKVNYLEVGKPMAEVKGIYIKKLPIAVESVQRMKEIENLVLKMLEVCQLKYTQKQTFINYIINAYEPKKITDKFDKIEKCSFKEFIEELKKQKVKLSPAEQMELLPLYEKHKNSINDIDKEINNVQNMLDEKIFNIYKIPANIINIIESCV